MKELIPFEFKEKNIRVVLRDGDPWFVAADVCAILELENVTNAVRGLDDDEITLKSFKGSRGRKVNIISESGLYALILRSYKPEAKPFRKWVTAEVLPSIRKTGQYKADWWRGRHEAASSYKVMSEVTRLAREMLGKDTKPHHYINEARLINWVMTGHFTALDRDSLSAAELNLLARLEERNACLIGMKISYPIRKQALKEYLGACINQDKAALLK